VFLFSETPFFIEVYLFKVFWLLLRLQITNNPVIPVKTKNIKASSTIRFRRWSRAGYAMFCSLACAVTIGCVVASISDKSLQKAAGVSNNSHVIHAVDIESPDKLSELLDLEATISQTHELSFITINADSTVACCQISNIYLLISTVEMSLSHLNRFLFYSV